MQEVLDCMQARRICTRNPPKLHLARAIKINKIIQDARLPIKQRGLVASLASIGAQIKVVKTFFDDKIKMKPSKWVTSYSILAGYQNVSRRLHDYLTSHKLARC